MSKLNLSHTSVKNDIKNSIMDNIKNSLMDNMCDLHTFM